MYGSAAKSWLPMHLGGRTQLEKDKRKQKHKTRNTEKLIEIETSKLKTCRRRQSSALDNYTQFKPDRQNKQAARSLKHQRTPGNRLEKKKEVKLPEFPPSLQTFCVHELQRAFAEARRDELALTPVADATHRCLRLSVIALTDLIFFAALIFLMRRSGSRLHLFCM